MLDIFDAVVGNPVVTKFDAALEQNGSSRGSRDSNVCLEPCAESMMNKRFDIR